MSIVRAARLSAGLRPGNQLDRPEPQEHDPQGDPEQADAVAGHEPGDPSIDSIERADELQARLSAFGFLHEPLSPCG